MIRHTLAKPTFKKPCAFFLASSLVTTSIRSTFIVYYSSRNNLALIGTTDPELDNIVLDLDEAMKKANVPDDKIYANTRYFFSNMTLVRFSSQPSQAFREQVLTLSESIQFEPYLVDSVTLLSCNAVFKKQREIGTWQLQPSKMYNHHS